MANNAYDVVIVGAGVSGAASAMWISHLDCSVCVLEAEEDVCSGTSKANSAIVHAGFDAQAGSLMAKLNVEGNQLMYQLSRELGFACKRVGSLVVCTDEATRGGLQDLLERGRKNGVPDLRIVERDELRAMEPNVSDAAVAALWAPTGGIVDPFGLNIAMAENAVQNGATFVFNARVIDVRATRQNMHESSSASRGHGGRDGQGGSGQGGYPWAIETTRGTYYARCVVNAAGVYADQLHNMVSPDQLRITPRKGEYLLLDTTAGDHVRHTVFALPTAMGKGVLVTPTVHGNLLVGPTATDIANKEGTNTTADGLAEVARKCAITVKDVPLRETITSFAGLRAHQPGHEFIIREVEEAPQRGFVDCAGIESPGLTASPAIGRMVAGIVQGILGVGAKPEERIVRHREPIPKVKGLVMDEWSRLIEQDRRFGHVVCRCCRVTEGEIAASLHETLPARSLDGVKRRTCAGMGRCQGGFCTPKVMAIMEREVADMSASDVTKSGPGSELIVGANKTAQNSGGAVCQTAQNSGGEVFHSDATGMRPLTLDDPGETNLPMGRPSQDTGR